MGRSPIPNGSITPCGSPRERHDSAPPPSYPCRPNSPTGNSPACCCTRTARARCGYGVGQALPVWPNPPSDQTTDPTTGTCQPSGTHSPRRSGNAVEPLRSCELRLDQLLGTCLLLSGHGNIRQPEPAAEPGDQALDDDLAVQPSLPPQRVNTPLRALDPLVRELLTTDPKHIGKFVRIHVIRH